MIMEQGVAAMPDSFTTVTRTGWGSNIMNSFVGVLFGILLFIGSFAVLWFNEGRTNMADVARNSVPVVGTSINQSTNGKLVAVSGTLTSNELLGDAPVLQPGEYIQVERNVEMYAWEEKKSSETTKDLGGGSTTTTTYTYSKTWTSSPASSSSFEHPEGHNNPDMSITSETFTVGTANVGAYALAPSTLELPQGNEIKLTTSNTNPAEGQSLVSGYLFSGDGSLQQPRVGDIRVSYKGLPGNSQVTIFGKQEGSQLNPFISNRQDRLYRAFLSNRDDAIATMNSEYTVITWILRLVGFLMMWIGLSMLFGPITAVLDVLPFLGNIAEGMIGVVTFVVAFILSAITILISIILHNILVMIIVLALLVGGIYAWRQMQISRARVAA
jgi:hypothetical protein